MLNRELRELRPRRILMITGWSWAAPFLNGLDVHQVSGRPFIEATGVVTLGGVRSELVVVSRPEYRNEKAFVNEAVATFSSGF